MTEKQSTEIITIHNRLVELQNIRRELLETDKYRLSYGPSWTREPISDILDRHDAMIREEIDREIKELTERIKQI